MKNSVIHYCLLVVTILIALGLNTGASQSATLAPQNSDYYVDAVNGDDATGDGSLTNPWRTITWALLQASGPGDTLHAQPGVYDTTLGESFPIQLSGGVSLIGADRDTTIISGASNTSVVQISSSSTNIFSDTVLSDVTLQYGSTGVRVFASGGRTVGPTIFNVRARYNTHGVAIESGKYLSSGKVNPLLTRVFAHDNTKTGFYIRPYYTGSSATPVISLCVSYNNGTQGMWIEGVGTGGKPGTAAPVISDTWIAYNGSHGVYLTASYEGRSNPRLDRCLLEHNGGWGVYWKPGINGAHVNAKLYDDIIVHNQQGGLRWGAYGYPIAGGSARIVNNTIAANAEYGIHWNNGTGGITSIMVINTILWNENADDLYATSSPGWTTAHVQYSDIEDGDFAGAWGNFSADPLFVETADGPFHLGSGSPAIDRGDTTLSDLSSLDWDWDPRVVNGVVDVGADEVAPSLLASAKLAPSTAAPGQIITYTIIARNDGALDITGARLTDTLPAPATYVPDSLSASAGGAGAASGVITWTGDLSTGTPVTLTFAVTTSSTLPDTLLTNTAVITHPLLNAPQVLTATTALYRVNLYSSQKTVVPEHVVPGEALTYTLVVPNTGIDTANACLTDTLPAGLTYVPGSLVADVGNANVSGQMITWAGTLTPGAVAHVQFRASTDPALPDGAIVTNSATVTDGCHLPFEITAPPVLVGRYRTFLPVTMRNWPLCNDYIVNGGFESGPPGAPWVQYSSGGYELIDQIAARTGNWGVFLGGYNSANERIYQTVSIPADSSATLSYYWAMFTQEPGTGTYDHLYVRIKNTAGSTLRTVQTLSNRSTQGQWVHQSFDISEFAGQTVRIEFAHTADSVYPTAFYAEDVSLWTCGPNVTLDSSAGAQPMPAAGKPTLPQNPNISRCNRQQVMP